MDRNSGQNKKVTERVYNSTDINRIALGYKDDKVKVERSADLIRQQSQMRKTTPTNTQQRASASTQARRQPTRTGSTQQRSRTPSGNARRPKRHNRGGEGFFRFLVVLVVLILACVLVFSFVGNEKPSSNNEGTSSYETKETAPQSSNTDETTAEIVTTAPETEAPVPSFSFVADLSEYETYMNPEGDQRDAYLVLVNPDHPLGSDYIPDDLVNVKSTRKDGRTTQKLRLYAAKALEALMLEADACGMVNTKTPSGYPLSVMSAYRSYAYQASLFNTYVNNEMKKGISRAEAEAIVVTYSCRAGTSEHQSGLCVDMHTLWSAGQAFAKEDEAKWLAENCHKFGFVLRFPEDKTDITKITYEPWHFRYVGRYHAVKMHELDMCLEEYTEYLKTVKQ